MLVLGVSAAGDALSDSWLFLSSGLLVVFCSAGGMPPAPDLGAMFGAPTDGDPLGLMSDLAALRLPGSMPPP